MSSGRYQSKLFSFFSQQSLRLKDKASQTWRRAKLAAVWGTQIALYPIYALFQTGRLLGKQMGQAARQAFPRLRGAQRQILHPPDANSALPTLPSDAPIQNLLESCLKIVSLPSTASLVHNSSAENFVLPTFIQGVSSLLTTRTLVLVTAENELLNVLTLDQQTQLQRQIIWELAQYWRHQKQQLQAAHSSHAWNNTFLPLPKEQPNLLPPVRAFRNLMAWVQVSPVAIATNLFQESRLEESRLEQLSLSSIPPSDIYPSELHPFVDDLFSNTSPPPSLLSWVKHQAKGIAELSKSWASLLTQSSIVLYDPLSKSEPEGFSEKFPEEVFSPQPSRSLPKARTISQPWLKMEDFFGGEFLGVTGAGQIVPQVDNGEVEARVEEAISPSWLESETLEAEVTDVSYEKHPLEQLLQWLDQGMLWIEQKLGQVWGWIQRP